MRSTIEISDEYEHQENKKIDDLMREILMNDDKKEGEKYHFICGPRGIGKSNSMITLLNDPTIRNKFPYVIYFNLIDELFEKDLKSWFPKTEGNIDMVNYFVNLIRDISKEYRPLVVIDGANKLIKGNDPDLWRKLPKLANVSKVVLVSSDSAPLIGASDQNRIMFRAIIRFTYSITIDEILKDFMKKKFSKLDDNLFNEMINLFGQNFEHYFKLSTELPSNENINEWINHKIKKLKKRKKTEMQTYLLPDSYTVDNYQELKDIHIIEDENRNIIHKRKTRHLYQQWLYLYDMIKNIQEVAEEQVNNDENYQNEIKIINEDNKLNENEENDEKLKIKNKYLHQYEHNATVPRGADTDKINSVNLLVKHHILTPINGSKYVIYDLFTYRCLLEMINDIRLDPNDPTENFSDWNEYVVPYIKTQRKNYLPIKNLPRLNENENENENKNENNTKQKISWYSFFNNDVQK